MKSKINWISKTRIRKYITAIIDSTQWNISFKAIVFQLRCIVRIEAELISPDYTIRYITTDTGYTYTVAAIVNNRVIYQLRLRFTGYADTIAVRYEIIHNNTTALRFYAIIHFRDPVIRDKWSRAVNKNYSVSM